MTLSEQLKKQLEADPRFKSDVLSYFERLAPSVAVEWGMDPEIVTARALGLAVAFAEKVRELREL